MTQNLSISTEILHWYDKNKRVLPWRSDRPEAYPVWLSEIMLQQTTVPTVMSYFLKFMQKWPTVHDLAQASLDQILVEWQGLGYYSRARNLHKCAHHVSVELKGVFPKTAKELQQLPGVGPYTAAAIASIVFDQPEAVVDGNIVRVLSRLAAFKTPYPDSKPQINELAASLTPEKRPGCYAQALMDLGSAICKPKNPKCDRCPVISKCQAFAQGNPGEYPLRKPKGAKPVRHAWAFLIQDKEQRILLQRRAEKGLLGGMMEVPTSPWQEGLETKEGALAKAPLSSSYCEVGEIQHTFTHFHLKVRILKANMLTPGNGIWVKPRDLEEYALPTLMKKIIKKGIKNVEI